MQENALVMWGGIGVPRHEAVAVLTCRMEFRSVSRVLEPQQSKWSATEIETGDRPVGDGGATRERPPRNDAAAVGSYAGRGYCGCVVISREALPTGVDVP